MPVAQSGRPPARQAVLIGLGALCGFLAVVFIVTQLDQLGGGEEAQIELGNPIFTVGNAAEISPLIAEQGPLFLPDAARGDRDIYVQHLGDDPNDGWSAFGVRQPGDPRECFVEWVAADRTFVDTCTEMEYPESGEGLPVYAVSVNPDGDLTINLNPVG